MKSLEGHVALIAGGAKGIGRGIARCFARDGARVFIADVDVEKGEETAAALAELGIAGTFIRADLRSKEELFGFVETAARIGGRVDVMVNNAYALSPEVPFQEKTDEMLQHVLGGGFYPTWWGMHAVFPHMREQGRGRIINMFSGDAESGVWFRADFVASKSAVLGITRNAAHEWARFRINCNLICPAAAGTLFVENAKKNPQHVAAFNGRNPTGRMGDPERDIGPVAVFLASDDSRYVTGELIHVDGGQHLPRRQSKPADVDAWEAEWQAAKQEQGAA
jgi:NAD(P)-dependent dehydrogenase (short-subunit alcohol dehydrogenase family)